MAPTKCQSTAADIIDLSSVPEKGIPVADAIQAGIDLMNKKKKNCDKKKTTVKPVYRADYPQCPRCYVKKILYPEPDVYPGCNHDGSFKFQLRMGINRQHHLKMLASPNPVILIEIQLILIFVKTSLLLGSFGKT